MAKLRFGLFLALALTVLVACGKKSGEASSASVLGPIPPPTPVLSGRKISPGNAAMTGIQVQGNFTVTPTQHSVYGTQIQGRLGIGQVH